VPSRHRDHEAAGKVADFCRFKWGMTYAETYAYVNRKCPIGLPEWDELLYQCDMAY
jgi:hypothetical protein